MSMIELDDVRNYLETQALKEKPSRPEALANLSSEVCSRHMSSPIVSQGDLQEQRSPDSSPGVTFRSTPTNISPKASLNPGNNCHSLMSESPLVQVPENLLLRAISRRQTEPSLWDPNASVQDVDCPNLRDDTLLEPLPHERVQMNFSEIFDTKLAAIDSGFEITGFGGHRDTFAVLGLRLRKHQGVELPATFFERLVRFIDFDTYLSVRLSCRSWSAAVSQVRPLEFSPVYRLPAEILQETFSYLSPVDFNAARHTCRAWMIASLDNRLLKTMLKRGGWENATLADEATLKKSRPQVAITQDWPLSKRLATECQLRPEWTGNGLDDPSRKQIGLGSGIPKNKAAMSLLTEIDFSDLTSSPQSEFEQAAFPLLTPSICGHYLLVTVDRKLLVYMLKSDSYAQTSPYDLAAVTSLVCPRQILAVSMDTSCGRFTVAALLEGRVGLVCDLSHIPQTSRNVCHKPSNARFEISGDNLVVEEPVADESLAYHNKRGMMIPWAKMEMPFTSSPEGSPVYPSPEGIPLEKGPRSIYRNLCSSEDPPRSVAICPQRRCVAFGCSAGIELHWTDVLTGQDMNRWFPLTNSSDYLYFVPPRLDTDPIARLRLTSSAVHPTEKASFEGKIVSPELVETRENESVWECMGTIGAFPPTPPPEPIKVDHYQTVPLSDGCHALFIDPETDCVCLGVLPEAADNDANFERRVFLLRPSAGNKGEVVSIPRCHTAAPELFWGVRIAIGYSDGSLYLFSVPRDMFLASRCTTDQLKLGWLEEYNASRRSDPSVNSNNRQYESVHWPVYLPGILVAVIDGLEDVVVDGSNGNVKLWAFSDDGMVRKWEMNTGVPRRVKKSIVLGDGTITDATEEDGDWIMRNAPWIPSFTPSPANLDGTTSALGFHLASRNDFHDPLSDSDSGYASDEGEPSTSVNLDDAGSLTSRFGRMRLSDSDVEMLDVDEDYVSARQSRAPTPMEIDIPSLADQLVAGIALHNPEHERLGEDEGYDSDEPSQWPSGPTAIRIPPLTRRWSGESFKEHDWTPDYLLTRGWDSEDGGDNESLDLLDLAHVEVEIL